MATIGFTSDEWKIIERYLGLSPATSANVKCECGSVVSITAMPKHKLSKLHMNRLEWGDKFKERLDASYICACGGSATPRSIKRHNSSVKHQKFLSTH